MVQMIIEDPGAAHQIRLITIRHGAAMAVSCTCLWLGRKYGYVPLRIAVRWQPGETYSTWLAHLGPAQGDDNDAGSQIRGPRLL